MMEHYWMESLRYLRPFRYVQVNAQRSGAYIRLVIQRVRVRVLRVARLLMKQFARYYNNFYLFYHNFLHYVSFNLCYLSFFIFFWFHLLVHVSFIFTFSHVRFLGGGGAMSSSFLILWVRPSDETSLVNLFVSIFHLRCSNYHNIIVKILKIYFLFHYFVDYRSWQRKIHSYLHHMQGIRRTIYRILGPI